MKVIRREISAAPEALMKKIERSLLPPLPKNIDDVHASLNSMEIKTTQGENLLLINDCTEHIIAFATNRNVEYLKTVDHIFMDGTFSYAPKHFYQMFTIHSVENGNYVPLIFCLLPDKKELTYKALFKLLCEKFQEQGFLFTPKQITVDFEVAIHTAIKLTWPTAVLIGCRFHLTQAWWRKIQQLGLSKEYRSEPQTESGKWLHWVFGLSMLDATEVEAGFVEDLMSIQPRLVEAFSDYLVENYIDSESTFPPSIWASSSVTSERTTNACESFHAKFSRNFTHPHPNIFIFVEAIKEVQIDTSIGIRSSKTPRKITNYQYKKRLQYMESLCQRYRTGAISRLHFIQCASYQYKNN
ncbi:uncharacterized protein LOC128995650 [Macrosteles quadrilineatus]|uniref:uncharacterized protein LOC128995650 n=1 Tax=Macrosteles quadrilineatus TaxID=74068 RepID=UPI0023E299C8|nr:uncharacterized protein LOC128995650 [Macrosteles quadrilineatus]